MHRPVTGCTLPAVGPRAEWSVRRLLPTVTAAGRPSACGQMSHRAASILAALVVVLVAGCGGDAASTSAAGTSPKPCPSRSTSPRSTTSSPAARAVSCQATSADSASPQASGSVRWTGTIATKTSRAYIENHGGQSSCHDSWTGTLTFLVRATGRLAGSGLLNLTRVSCDFPSGGSYDPAKTYAFSVSGTQGGTGFTLVLARQGKVSGIIYAGLTALMTDGYCAAGTSPPIPVPFVGPGRTHAAGSSHLQVLMHGGVDVCGGSNNSDVLTADATFSLSGPGS